MDWMHLNEIMFQEMELMKSIIICCKITDDSDSTVLTGPGSVIHFKKKFQSFILLESLKRLSSRCEFLQH